jgi:hypothetical protein
MKRNNLTRIIILIIGGVTTLLGLWALDGGATITITFEEAVIGLLFGILSVLVINGNER